MSTEFVLMKSLFYLRMMNCVCRSKMPSLRYYVRGIQKKFRKHQTLGSGCGSVGRAVASDTRGPRFKSSHWQKFIYIEHLFPVNCVLKRRK